MARKKTSSRQGKLMGGTNLPAIRGTTLPAQRNVRLYSGGPIAMGGRNLLALPGGTGRAPKPGKNTTIQYKKGKKVITRSDSPDKK